jgi:hypothetical protein
LELNKHLLDMYKLFQCFLCVGHGSKDSLGNESFHPHNNPLRQAPLFSPCIDENTEAQRT